MRTDLTQFPGLRRAAVLGDLALLAGDAAQAQRCYAAAWAQGEAAGLVGAVALAPAPDPVLALGWLRALFAFERSRRLSRAEACALARLVLGWGADAGGEAWAALTLEARLQLPGLSVPDLHGPPPAAARAAALEEVRRQADAPGADGAALSAAILRAAALEPHPPQAPPPGLGLLEQLEEDVARIVALRVLDRVGPAGGEGLDEALLGDALAFLMERCADPAEARGWRRLELERRWRRGAWTAALELAEEGSGAIELATIQRLRAQAGLHAAAAAAALARAARTADPRLRLAFRMIALEALERGGERATAGELAWQILDELPDERVSAAVLELLFTRLEGAYRAAGQLDALEALWRSAGTRDRTIEAALLRPDSPQGWQGHPVARRLCLVRALAAGRRADAAAQLAAGAGRRPEEALLLAALRLDGDAPEDARELLEPLAYAPQPDLLAVLLLREMYQRLGRPERGAELLLHATRRHDASARAAVLALLAAEAEDADDPAAALDHARQAFQLDPLSDEVRDLYRRLASLARADDDLRRVSAILDNAELVRRLSASEVHGPQLAEIQRLAAGPEGQRRLAVTRLQWLARHVEDRPLRGALLRYGADLCRTTPGEEERAARMAADALRESPGDPLAARVALELLLALRRYPEAAALLERTSVRLLPEQAPALVEGARELLDARDPPGAARLAALAVELLPRDALEPLHAVALDLLDDAWAAAEDPRGLRDALERWLSRPAGPEVAAALHLRAGTLYRDRLGDRELAMEHLRRCLALDPGRPEALDALERLCRDAARHDELARLLQDRIERADDPRHARRRELAAVLAHDLRRPAEALEVLEALLDAQPDDRDAALEAAALSRQLGRFPRAAALLERAALLTPEPLRRAPLLADLGALRERHLRDRTGAIDALQAAWEADPDARDTLRRLEDLYERAGRHDDLLALLEDAVAQAQHRPALRPERDRLLARKAQLDLRLRRPEHAADALLDALRAQPAEPSWVREIEALVIDGHAPRAALLEAWSLHQRALPTHSPARLALLHRVVVAAAVDNDLDAVADACRLILASWPADAEAGQRLEALLQTQERWEELLHLYQARLQIIDDPADAVPLHHAVAQLAERRLRNFDLAIEATEKLLALLPGRVEVLQALGRLLEATRQWDRLLEISEREVRLVDAPKARAHVWFRIGSIQELQRGDLDAAIDAYEAAVAQDPAYVPALHGLREIFRRRERWEDVLDTLHREARLWTEPRERASVVTRIAEVCWQHLGRSTDAEAYLRSALALAPDFPPALRALLDLFLDQRRWAEAEPLSARLTLQSEGLAAELRSDLFIKRARVASALGNPREALAALQIALDIDPHNDDAFEAVLAFQPEAPHDAEHTDLLERFNATLVELGDLPRRARLVAHWGQLAEQRTLLDDARAHYEEAARLQPLSLDAHRPLVRLLMRLRRFEEVQHTWEALLHRLPPQAPARAPVLTLLGDLATDWRDDPEAGITFYDDALALDPEHPERWFLRAQAAVLLARWPDALEATARAVALLHHPEARTPAEHRLLASLLYYQGFIIERGLRDDERALTLYRDARRWSDADTRPVLAAARILLRQNNLVRLEHLVRGAAQSVAHAAGPAAAAPLHLFLAEVFLRARDLPRAEAELLAVVERSPGDAHIAEARFALVELYSRMSNGVPRAIAELHRILDLDPCNADALRSLGDLGQATRRHDMAWLCYEALVVLGAAAPPQERFVNEALRQRFEWIEPPPQHLTPEALDAHVLTLPELAPPLRRALSRLSPALAALFTPPPEPFRPLRANASAVQSLVAEIAAWMGAAGATPLVVPIQGGPAALASRIIHLPDEAAAAAPPQPRVLVPIDDGAPEGRRADAARRFLLGHALALGLLRLATPRALTPPHLASLLGLLHGLASSSDDLDALAAQRPWLAPTLAALVDYDGGRALRAAAVSLRGAPWPEPPPDNPEAAAAAARNLHAAIDHAADRLGLLAAGDLRPTLDALAAQERAAPLRPLASPERAAFIAASPRARRLLRFWTSEAHLSLRPLLGYERTPILPSAP